MNDDVPPHDAALDAPRWKRELTAADAGILLEASLINLNWPGPRYTVDDVVSTPAFAHYAWLDPDRGDYGVVVERADGWLGVAWVLFLPAESPGYGFVAPHIGEVSIAVQAGFRGAGLGRELLGDLLDAARLRGLAGLSLSVEAGNPARHLYDSMGFVDVPGAAAGTMLVTL